MKRNRTSPVANFAIFQNPDSKKRNGGRENFSVEKNGLKSLNWGIADHERANKIG